MSAIDVYFSVYVASFICLSVDLAFCLILNFKIRLKNVWQIRVQLSSSSYCNCWRNVNKSSHTRCPGWSLGFCTRVCVPFVFSPVHVFYAWFLCLLHIFLACFFACILFNKNNFPACIHPQVSFFSGQNATAIEMAASEISQYRMDEIHLRDTFTEPWLTVWII